MFRIIAIPIIASFSFLLASESPYESKIYTNIYGSYYVPKGHNRIAVNMIKKGQVYEAETLKYIAKIYQKGTDVVHLGTYFGDMLPFFSKLVGQNTVWAFEPVSTNFQCAAKNVELNGLTNVELLNLALSDRAAKLYMRTESEGIPCGGSSHVVRKPHDSASDSLETVDSTTLDWVLKEHKNSIGMIHLDVEGHELEVLRGAKETINTYRPIIILEIWPWNKEQFLKELGDMGYKPFNELDGNAFFAPLEDKRF